MTLMVKKETDKRGMSIK